MAGEPNSLLETTLYGPAIAAAIGGIPLWFKAGAAFGVGAFLISCASFLTMHYLLIQIRKANEQKRYLDKQLLQSHKLASLGELSSGIAHEINNPLAIIGEEAGWLQDILKRDSLKDMRELDEFRDSLQQIRTQSLRCREITHKMLDFARKKEPLIQRVDVNRLIEDMARLVEREAVNNNISIIREYAGELPLVHTDAPLLRQVVLNLFNNAAHAIGKDGSITITTRIKGDGHIDIAVSDTGCGIPKEHLGQIFDPFFTTKPPGKGTGLGLSICHGIITRLGGAISVETEMGKGTCFTIHLPLKYEKEANGYDH